MSDRMPASITIGGTIRRSLVEELCGQITESGAGPDWNDGCEPRTEADLLALVRNDGTIVLCDCEASYGKFEDLEGFLTQQHIPFDRHSDAKYEYDGEIVKFRPPDGWYELLATQDGKGTIEVQEIEEVVRQLDGIEGMRKQQLLAVLESVREDLRGLLVLDVPPVPPLEIVEG